jgi:hypothetical protein
MMTDLPIAPAHGTPAHALETMPQQIADVLAEWVKRLSAFPVSRTVCPAASELAGITRVERFDAAPWLSF